MTTKQLNIHRVYSQATADEMSAGLGWYKAAHDEAARLAKENNLTIEQTSAIIAALSPGLRWERNIEAAERVIRGRSLNGLGVRWYDGVKKARRIRKGQNPAVVLKGNKVRAFWSNILNPARSSAVCVDFHAHSIWSGNRWTADKAPSLSDGLYNRVATDYVVVAKDLGLTPCQLQAIVWVAWRRIHDVAI